MSSVGISRSHRPRNVTVSLRSWAAGASKREVPPTVNALTARAVGLATERSAAPERPNEQAVQGWWRGGRGRWSGVCVLGFRSEKGLIKA